MSTRTIIEINHDRIHELEREPGYFAALLKVLKSGDGSKAAHDLLRDMTGIRILGQRHHSETLKLTIE